MPLTFTSVYFCSLLFTSVHLILYLFLYLFLTAFPRSPTSRRQRLSVLQLRQLRQLRAQRGLRCPEQRHFRAELRDLGARGVVDALGGLAEVSNIHRRPEEKR